MKSSAARRSVAAARVAAAAAVGHLAVPIFGLMLLGVGRLLVLRLVGGGRRGRT